MIIFGIGRIIGKSTTNRFDFLLEGNANKFDFLKAFHPDSGEILCQIIELTKTQERLIAHCTVIGYKDSQGNIKQIRSPFDVGAELEKAGDDFIRSIIRLDNDKNSAYIGLLEGTTIPVCIDLNKLLTRHVAVLAKSGSGKSYTVGVLLEEIMERNVPLLVIDPHGEYESLAEENDNIKDISLMERFSVRPKAFSKKIRVYGDPEINSSYRPIRLSEKLSAQELIEVLPARLSSNQTALLFSALKDVKEINFSNLLFNLQNAENSLKWNLISIIEYLKGLNLFSGQPTSLNELVSPGRCSILNFKGADPLVQEIILFKLLGDLFQARKTGRIPPFFLVIEEAHNFAPEKGFSEAKCTKIIRKIASEGRKFGLGLCVVSQRPAIVQKTVLSQCTTQIILKVTNPNDLKSISASVEGINSESVEEIKGMSVGSALVTGVVDVPLIVNIRPRKTRHGGEAIDILGSAQSNTRFLKELKDYKDQKMMPLIKPKLSINDLKVMKAEEEVIETVLIPSVLFLCQNRGKEFRILVEMVNGSVVKDIEDTTINSAYLPMLDSMTKDELRVLEKAFNLKSFTKEEFFKKTGLSLSHTAELDGLLKSGYMELNSGRYEVTDRYILSDLSGSAVFYKVIYENTPYDHILEKKERLDSVKSRLSKFTRVLDHQQCYIVHYRIVKK